MKKDFQKWHIQKYDLHENGSRVPFFNEKDVWFSLLRMNVGFEQDGKGEEFLRPVVILKKFNKETLWGIPLTSRNKSGKYYFEFRHGIDSVSTANLSQLRLIDSKRLKYKIGSMSTKDFEELKKRIIAIIG
ncbi:MAG: type II toxin-antitoxin system PemK/MazF family toxin [Patescibacteria group bacterium]